MIEHVVPHLVSHDGADLAWRELLQHRVVKNDALSAEETGDVGVVVLRLAAGVDLVDLARRDPLRLGERQDIGA